MKDSIVVEWGQRVNFPLICDEPEYSPVSYTHLDVYKRQIHRSFDVVIDICDFYELLSSVFVCFLFWVLHWNLIIIVLLYPLVSAKYLIVYNSS